VDPAVVVSAKVGRAFAVGPSLVRLDLEGGIPVRADGLGPGSDVRDGGVEGHGAVRASWSW